MKKNIDVALLGPYYGADVPLNDGDAIKKVGQNWIEVLLFTH